MHWIIRLQCGALNPNANHHFGHQEQYACRGLCKSPVRRRDSQHGQATWNLPASILEGSCHPQNVDSWREYGCSSSLKIYRTLHLLLRRNIRDTNRMISGVCSQVQKENVLPYQRRTWPSPLRWSPSVRHVFDTPSQESQRWNSPCSSIHRWLPIPDKINLDGFLTLQPTIYLPL